MSKSRKEARNPARVETPITLNQGFSHSVLSTCLTTTAEAYLENYFSSHHYKNEEFIYCVNQLLRFAILYQLGTGPLRIAAVPFIKHYLNLFIEEEAITNYLTTGIFTLYDIATASTSLPQTTMECALALTASTISKKYIHETYHSFKEGNLYFSNQLLTLFSRQSSTSSTADKITVAVPSDLKDYKG